MGKRSLQGNWILTLTLKRVQNWNILCWCWYKKSDDDGDVDDDGDGDGDDDDDDDDALMTLEKWRLQGS